MSQSTSSPDAIVIPLSNAERAILPDVLASFGELVMYESPADAHVLWSHAGVMRGERVVFAAITDEWRIPRDDAEIIMRAIDETCEGLDAHIGPAYSGSELRRGRLHTLEATLQKLANTVGV